jgi:hypothetical protein
MRGFTQNRQIGIALPRAVMNRIPRQNGGSARGYPPGFALSALPEWFNAEVADAYIYAQAFSG